MRGDHVVFAESILETVSVLAVKHGYPVGLLPEVLEDCIVFVGEHLDRGACVAATKSQFGQHVLLFGQSLACTAVVSDVWGGLTLEDLMPSTEAVMQPFTRVDDIDLGVRPDPRGILVVLVVLDGGA